MGALHAVSSIAEKLPDPLSKHARYVGQGIERGVSHNLKRVVIEELPAQSVGIRQERPRQDGAQ